MKAKIDLFYEKHPYLSLLINLLLGSIIGISVEYLLNKDFIGSGFYTVLFLSVLEAFLDLSQYLGHILVETVKPFFLLLILQIPVGLDSESSYGFDFGYKILQCS